MVLDSLSHPLLFSFKGGDVTAAAVLKPRGVLRAVPCAAAQHHGQLRSGMLSLLQHHGERRSGRHKQLGLFISSAGPSKAASWSSSGERNVWSCRGNVCSLPVGSYQRLCG
uniref:Uncharacterized protein n=1 Tax=Nothobranchius kadleci TaxID=1051664 RepID=A0A1A8E4U6_NOTKA